MHHPEAVTAASGFLLWGENIRGRSCGTCKACCIQMPVADLNLTKASNTKCPNLNHKGCKIYPARPRSCRLFKCRWLFDPATADIKRPDISGYIIDTAFDTMVVDGREIEAFQVWVDTERRDAHKDPALRAYLEMIAKDFMLPTRILFSNMEGLLLVPPSLTKSGEWMEFYNEAVSPAAMAAALAAARASAAAP